MCERSLVSLSEGKRFKLVSEDHHGKNETFACHFNTLVKMTRRDKQ